MPKIIINLLILLLIILIYNSCNYSNNKPSNTDKYITKDTDKYITKELKEKGIRKRVMEDTLQKKIVKDTVVVDIESLLKEANDKFTYKGKPINPLALQDLCIWLSDIRPGLVSIDLESTYNSNRYYGDYNIDKDKWVTIDLKDGCDLAENKVSFFSYKKLGTLKNNIHVVEVEDYGGGGSGIFMDLLLITFSIDTYYENDGRKEKRILINCKGDINLCDRYEGKIRVKPTNIFIGKDNGYAKCRERDTIINFGN